MAQMLRRLRERVQGQLTVKNICSEVFKDYADGESNMALGDLEVAVLRVYNSLNKDLLGPHKEPPIKTIIKNKSKKEKISENEFCELVLEWTKADLRTYVAHKIVLALLAAPSLVLGTKSAAKRAPRIGPVLEKIPAPVFFSIYSVGLVLAQR